MDTLDRFRGTILGLAIGDALGAPIEGLKQGYIKELFGRVEDYVAPELSRQRKPYRYLPSGVYTDDTQQALCLAESLVRCYGFNPEDFVRTLLSLWNADLAFKTGAFRGAGAVFIKVMTKLASGESPLKAGEPSAGIGSAMRVAPVGLYFSEDQESLIKASTEQALLTHKDPRALALSCALSYVVSQFASGKWDSLKTKDWIEDLIEFTCKLEKQIEQEYIAYLPPLVYDFFGLFFRSIEPFRHWQGMTYELVFSQIVNLANQAFPSQKITSPAQNFALSCGVTALFLGLTSNNFEDGLIEAINLGKDADSLGAMTGAILGARFGESSIPDRWKRGLKNYHQLRHRADALFQKSFVNLSLIPLWKMELELTQLAMTEREKFVQKMIEKGEYTPEPISRKKAKAKTQEPSAIKPKRSSKKSKLRRKKTPWRTWE